ncbi:arginase family protein [Siccirubricoccus deserti]
MWGFAIALGDLAASLSLIEQQAAQHAHLVALGGEHSITLPLLRALAKRLGRPLGLLHFDAHLDTWETISARLSPMARCSGTR